MVKSLAFGQARWADPLKDFEDRTVWLAKWEMSVYITYQDLTSAETAAHIHGYAPRGLTAPPVFTLPTTNPKLGAWDYDIGGITGLLNETYVNIHTTNNTGGEIRGHIEMFDNTITVPITLSGFMIE